MSEELFNTQEMKTVTISQDDIQLPRVRFYRILWNPLSEGILLWIRSACLAGGGNLLSIFSKMRSEEFIKRLVLPGLACLLFLIVWTTIAVNVEVRSGTLPTPLQVWEEGKLLWDDFRLDKVKEREFYQRQEALRVRWVAQFPDKEWVPKKYSGKVTYFKQIFISLQTVFTGFFLASVIAIPLGILCGISRTFYQSINPLIQIFKPVSPLAWLPMVMILVSAWYNPAEPWFEKSFLSSAIVVALCSLWPTLINTAGGVAGIDPNYLNVARVLKLGVLQKVFKIILPASLPSIFTGLRLSLGIGWMVLIAAEMLTQSPGLGKFVWDMFQNGSSRSLAQICVALFTIGFIGFLLDQIMTFLQKIIHSEEHSHAA